VNITDRKMCWETDSIGAATLTRVGARLIILTEKGELVQAPATPKGFQPGSRAQVLPPTIRAFPALADGCLYARNQERLVCLDLRQRQ